MNWFKTLIAAASIGAASCAMADNENMLVVEVKGESWGEIEIELFHNVAPRHSERLKSLARSGAYDMIVFHRVIEGFMAQTGDVRFGKKDGPEVQMAGMGGSSLPNLEAEFSDIPFEKGVVGMARARDPNSANSQFFIMFEDAPHLNGQYTVVGRVVSGQDVVDAIKKGGPPNGAVVDPDYMARVRVKSDL